MTPGEKLLKRLEATQKSEGKPILVSIMILVGNDGQPACWFVKEFVRAEGLEKEKPVI